MENVAPPFRAAHAGLKPGAALDFAFQYTPQSRTVSYIARTFSIGTRACTL
jgi:hypothetical protein